MSDLDPSTMLDPSTPLERGTVTTPPPTIDVAALREDLTAIRNRLDTVVGYKRLTITQRSAVLGIRNRADVALGRLP